MTGEGFYEKLLIGFLLNLMTIGTIFIGFIALALTFDPPPILVKAKEFICNRANGGQVSPTDKKH